MPIHFGTSGWRAIVGEEFTFSNVRKVTQAIAKYLKNHRLQKKGVIVGYDTRASSRQFAKTCAQSLASDNIKVFLTKTRSRNRRLPRKVIHYYPCSLRSSCLIFD